MKIGYIGLGKMGKNMVLHLLEEGIEVVAWNRSEEPRQEVAAAGANATQTIEELVNQLETPRVVWLMLPAGEVTDGVISTLIPLLTPNDLVIDGANSFYKNTVRRGETFKKNNIRFMDIGVSGGPDGARNGACLMIGGQRRDFEAIEPLAKAASAKDAYGYFGELGSGHFAKMVHNGIEYGMMEAIAEGAAVLKKSEFKLNLAEVFRVYNNRSVIESRLVGWTHESLLEDSELSNISSTIAASGEGEWTINAAKEEQIGVPTIKAAFDVRTNSANDNETSGNGFRNKVVSAQRGKFGHHKVEK